VFAVMLSTVFLYPRRWLFLISARKSSNLTGSYLSASDLGDRDQSPILSQFPPYIRSTVDRAALGKNLFLELRIFSATCYSTRVPSPNICSGVKSMAHLRYKCEGSQLQPINRRGLFSSNIIDSHSEGSQIESRPGYSR
jgi:hypothetical protein